MTQDKIARLKALAERATPGEWKWGDPDYDKEHNPPDSCASAWLDGGDGESVLSGCGNCGNIFYRESDGECIAAANPRAILSLIAQIEALLAWLESEEAVEECANLIDLHQVPPGQPASATRRGARAVLAVLKEKIGG